MALVIRMPSILAGAEEAALASWLIAPGDTVAVGTPLAEIETEKAMVEYAAEDAGVVGRLLLEVGETAGIGDPIAVLVADGETSADIDAVLGVTAAAPPPPAEILPPAAAEAAPTGNPNGHQAAPPAVTLGRIFASPIVRKIAHERGIDLTSVAGTGPNGRIVRRDIERVAVESTPAQSTAVETAPVEPAPPAITVPVPEAPASAGSDDRLIPHTPMRRAIARRLAESKATVPHFYMAAECVVDELLELRARINETAAVKVSVNDFVVLAAAAAFGDVPEANVTWSDDGLIAHRNVDISIAVATEGGLVTPVLRDVGSRKLSEIARQARDLAERARDRRLKQPELEGGVFSVSNLGMYGTLEFSAIINPPQSGILAVGTAKQQPVAVDGELRVATVMRATLSVDHRAIDGALAARWLAAFTTRLEHPLSAII
jgi:pyruvate dehydrogenase E2 component (dihydrolipoamide acetyltransferase)